MQAGLSGVNLSNPILLALIAAGADETEFANASRIAVEKGKASFSYVLGMVKKQREDAAGLVLHKGAMPAKRSPTPDNFAEKNYGTGGAL